MPDHRHFWIPVAARIRGRGMDDSIYRMCARCGAFEDGERPLMDHVDAKPLEPTAADREAWREALAGERPLTVEEARKMLVGTWVQYLDADADDLNAKPEINAAFDRFEAAIRADERRLNGNE